MRSDCVGNAYRRSAVRAFASLTLAALLMVVMAVPEAEARRKRRHVPTYAPPFASIVYDVNSGRVLQSTNADLHRHPASVTKVMTLYMLFEQMEKGRFKLTSELPVSREAASQAPSKLGLRPGDTIAVEDAIKALVTKSANDIAVVVAEAIGGDEERFAAMMTRKAHAIGMRRTVFRNASGLPDPRQVTTARDLVTLGKAIQDRFPRQYGYFSTRVFNYEGTAYRNHNRLLGNIEGVDGIKTGYTRASGFNLLTSVKADGRHLIAVVLGGRSARSRDAQVAGLVDDHMDRAYAGRRTTAKSVDVATRDDAGEDEEDGKSAPVRENPALASSVPVSPALPPARLARQGAAPIPAPIVAPPVLAAATSARLQPSGLPQPPNRPRPAVIAETGPRTPGEDQSLMQNRRLALSASGSTNNARGATTPLALVGTTPRSPAMRWVPGPQPTELPRPRSAGGEPRLVPPGNVRYTNAVPAEAPKADEAQPLPTGPAPHVTAEAPPKVEDRKLDDSKSEVRKTEVRLPSMSARAELAAIAPPPVPEVTTRQIAAASVAKPVVASPPKLATPTRSGWVIQLAATDSEAKARSLLEAAVDKTGRLLKEAEPYTETVVKGGTTLYRARFAGFDADEAQSTCKTLKRSGIDCFAQKI